MSFDPFAYELGYWTGRSGQLGVFVSASMRVGYQHGAVAHARDNLPADSDLSDSLATLSRLHESWCAAARRGDKLEQQAASDGAERIMRDLAAVDSLKEWAPALYRRVSVAPGINLVF